MLCQKNKETDLVLASESTTRQALLRAVGLSFICHPAHIDEENIRSSFQLDTDQPEDIALFLAKTKSERISNFYPESLVIGSDQILSLDSLILGKSRTVEDLRNKLVMLRGRRHSLFTGVVVSRGGTEIWRHIDVAHLTVRPFSDDFLEQYLDKVGLDVLSSVGGYHVEDCGIQLFSEIQGDWTTVKGLTILPLINFLREHGYFTE